MSVVDRQGGISFILLGGMELLLLAHLPFYSNPSRYAQASKLQSLLDQTCIPDHALVSRFVFSIYLFHYLLRVTAYYEFFMRIQTFQG